MKYEATRCTKVGIGLHPDAYAAAASYGNVPHYVDTKGFDEALVIAMYGAAAANAESDISVQESPSTTAASFAHIAGSSMTQVTPTAGTYSAQLISIDLRNPSRKRYLRVKNKGDGSNAAEVAACIVLMGAKNLPTTHPTAISSTWTTGVTVKARL